jgi:hypothetical protein
MDDLKRIEVGSKAFFSSFDDFKPKDGDVMIIMDNPPRGKTYQVIRMRNTDYFIYKKMSKNDFIHFCITMKQQPMRAGMFLVPEFVEAMGVTIDDLVLLQNVFYHIDDKHSYEKLIYDYYIKNNGFYLTEEQLKAAYDEYKSKRKEFYSGE